MISYLITGGELPWSVDEIREELGLLDPSFDKIIKAVIASQCIEAGCGMRGAVWAIPQGSDRAGLGRLVNVGPAYQRGKDTYHDCEYEPDPVKARKAFRSIINWCWDDLGISDAIVRERRGEYRQPVFMEAAE